MSILKPLILIAAGGHAAEVLSYLVDLEAAGDRMDFLGALDDGQPVGPWESSSILGGLSSLPQLLARSEWTGKLHYITCVGNNAVRDRLVDSLQPYASQLEAWSLRHPSAQIGRSVTIGAGTLLAPGVILTTRSVIGQHCILNVRVSVHHDCTVGDFVNINPAATVCGNVSIGDGAFIGAGATVINGMTIGSNAIVGAGAVVTRDVPNDVTVVGVPARIVRDRR